MTRRRHPATGSRDEQEDELVLIPLTVAMDSIRLWSSKEESDGRKREEKSEQTGERGSASQRTVGGWYSDTAYLITLHSFNSSTYLCKKEHLYQSLLVTITSHQVWLISFCLRWMLNIVELCQHLIFQTKPHSWGRLFRKRISKEKLVHLTLPTSPRDSNILVRAVIRILFLSRGKTVCHQVSPLLGKTKVTPGKSLLYVVNICLIKVW